MKIPYSLDIITPMFRMNGYYFNDPNYPELNKIKDADLKKEIYSMNELGNFNNTFLLPVSKKTPIKAREALELIAIYFRREEGYDFVLYSRYEHRGLEEHDPRDRFFLFVKKDGWGPEKYIALGGVVFRWRKFTNGNPKGELALQWVWLHPFIRNCGFFSKYWEIFKSMYGDFYVEPPLSKAMSHLVDKHPHSHFANVEKYQPAGT